MNNDRLKKGNHIIVIARTALAVLVAGTSVATTAIASTGTADEATTIELLGQCAYGGDALERARQGVSFAACRSVRIEQNGSIGSIDFRSSLGGPAFRYDGAWTGNGLTITHFSFRGGSADEAQGDCRIFRNGGKISTVTCVAKVGGKTFIGGKTFAANFVASRINP